jgi:hypothetical protein
MLLRKVFEAVANDILGAGNQFGGRSKLVAKFHPLQVKGLREVDSSEFTL